MFVHDCLLFCKATVEEAGALKGVLDSYELVSGQAVNFAKSGIFYSSNVGSGVRSDIAAMLGKMAWRLVKDQDSLVCRVLKAKYFPRSSFFDAGLGCNPSVFTVKSAYSLAEGLVQDQSLVVNEGWGKLWKLSVSPKVKLSLVHEKVEELALRADYVEDFVLQALANLEGDDVVEFTMVVWECRNDRVFNSRKCTAATAVYLARKLLLDWEVSSCKSRDLGSSRPAVRRGIGPRVGG
ncbi:hypothetical protein ACS0TY_010160 [Phlomoides rotata]